MLPWLPFAIKATSVSVTAKVTFVTMVAMVINIITDWLP